MATSAWRLRSSTGHTRSSTVLGGMVLHPLDRAADAWSFYRQFTDEASDELTVFFGLVHAPDGSGTKVAAMPLCHCGPDPAQADAEVAALRRFGPPAVDLVERMPYPRINTLLDEAFPEGRVQLLEIGVLTGAQ